MGWSGGVTRHKIDDYSLNLLFFPSSTASLAVIDTVVLFIGLLRLWLAELVGFDFQDSGDWICKLTVVLGYVASDLSVWLIIAVTVER